MRILTISILLFTSFCVKAQIQPYQVRGNTPKDILWILGTDTLSSSGKYGLGKWYNADSLNLGCTGVSFSIAEDASLTLVDCEGDTLHFFGGGDTDWLKLDDVSIPNNADSMQRDGYMLLSGLEGGLATKIEFLKEGLIQFDSEEGEISGRTYMKVKPLQQSEVNNNWYYSLETSPGAVAQNNNIHWMGWNLLGGGTRATGTGTAFGESTEDHYSMSSSLLFYEWHRHFIDSSGVGHRIQSYVIDKGDFADWYGYNTLGRFSYIDPTNDMTYARFERSNTDGAGLQLLGSASGFGAEIGVNATGNSMSIANYFMTDPILYLHTFDYTFINKAVIQNSGPNPITTIAGRDGSGIVGVAGEGYGINVTASGDVEVDTTMLVTPDDISDFAVADHDFHEVGGSLPPDGISDNIFKNGGKTGLGTIDPLTKLHIGNKVDDDASFAYDTNALMVVSQIPATGLNDPKSVLLLARKADPGVVYGLAASMNLSRYENSGANSRTRLDFSLAHSNFNLMSNDVLTLLSDKSVILTGYPDSRDDGTPVNFLGTSSTGVIQSYPVTDIAGGGGDQTFINSDDATSHTVTLSDGGGSIEFDEGCGIDFSTTGTADDGILTILNTGVITMSNGWSGTDHTFAAVNCDAETSGSLSLTEGCGITLTTTGDAENATVELASTGVMQMTNASAATTHTIYQVDCGSDPHGSLTFTEGTGITLTTTGDIDDGVLTIATTVTDTDTDDQGLTIAGSGPTYDIAIDGGSDVTIQGVGITLSESPANTLVFTATDASATNEIQTLSASGGTDTYGINLSSSGGTVNLIEGTNITIDRTGDDLTINAAGGAGDTDDQFLTIAGSGPNYTVDIDGGTDVIIAAGTGISLSEVVANTLTITNTVVDTDTDAQDITANGAGPTSYTIDVSGSATAVTLAEGTGINLTRSTNTITVASTITDTDTDDQGLTLTGTSPFTFDIDGGSDIIVSEGVAIDLSESPANTLIVDVDGGEFSTVTTPEADDYVLMWDDDGPEQKILYSDIYDLIIADAGSDGNGMWTAANDNTDIANSSFNVGVPGYLEFRDGSDHDVYIDAANNLIGFGTDAPLARVHVKNTSGTNFLLENSSSNTTTEHVTRSHFTGLGAIATQTFKNRDTDIDKTGDQYTVAQISVTKSSATVVGGAMTFSVGFDTLNMDNIISLNSRETGATDGYTTIAGGLRYKWTSSASSSVTLNTGYYGLTMTTTGAKTATLPDAVAGSIGQAFEIFNDGGTGNITVAITGGSGDSIIGDTTVLPDEKVRVEQVTTTKWAISN